MSDGCFLNQLVSSLLNSLASYSSLWYLFFYEEFLSLSHFILWCFILLKLVSIKGCHYLIFLGFLHNEVHHEKSITKYEDRENFGESYKYFWNQFLKGNWSFILQAWLKLMILMTTFKTWGRAHCEHNTSYWSV
jgi:hypothetical protein